MTTFRNATTVDQSTGSANITINKPAGVVDNDILYAAIHTDSATTITAPSGWSIVDTASDGTIKVITYQKLAASEGASWQWTSGVFIYLGHVAAWSGEDTTTPLETAAAAHSQNTGSDSTAEALTVTPQGGRSDDMNVVTWASWNATSVSSGFPPSGYTSRASYGSNGDLMRVAELQLSSSAATGTQTITWNAANNWAAFQMLIVNAAAAATTQAAVYAPAPKALRAGGPSYLRHRVQTFDTTVAAPTDTNFQWPQRTSIRGGPPALRARFRGGRLPDPVATSDVSVALTGIASAVSSGSFAVTLDVPITGSASTVSAGTFAPATSVSLSGNASTVSAGSFTPATNVALAGSATTVSSGTLVPSTAVAITGAASSVAAGALAAETSVGLGGIESTTSAGTLAPSTTVALIGASALGRTGNLTATGGDASTTQRKSREKTIGLGGPTVE